MWPLAAVGVGLGLYELAMQAPEISDRHETWSWARAYCAQVAKPLLRIGMRRSPLEPPNGDVTLDIDPAIRAVPGGVQGDERDMRLFADGQFGVAFNEHTLEHLLTPADVPLAVRECLRVADYAVFLFPSARSLVARLHPTHQLQLTVAPGGLRVWRLGADASPGLFVPVPNATPLQSGVVGSWG